MGATMNATSPTDIVPEPFCSFCGTPRKACRVLISSEINRAFVCELCAPTIAAQARDILRKQEEENHG